MTWTFEILVQGTVGAGSPRGYIFWEDSQWDLERGFFLPRGWYADGRVKCRVELSDFCISVIPFFRRFLSMLGGEPGDFLR
jgi:hypothetical protein